MMERRRPVVEEDEASGPPSAKRTRAGLRGIQQALRWNPQAAAPAAAVPQGPNCSFCSRGVAELFPCRLCQLQFCSLCSLSRYTTT